MSESNHYAPPKADLSLSEEPVDTAKLALADTSVKRARLGFVFFFGALLVQFFGFAKRPELSGVFLLVYLLSFTAAHVFLGQAAVRARRSWVLYGLAPVLVPLLGGLISFGFLRAFIPEPSQA